ncbi:tyrosine-protein kinase JAK2-like [Narcine bancroftii]|uniref:tyrosine-protein kinase JAK2-like n=1 Tax=Narcine bancroftii TaxID=1343680 RepID=UPI0038319F76
MPALHSLGKMSAAKDTVSEHRASEGSSLKIHLYHATTPHGETTMEFCSGRYTAEELCTFAAQASGILPIYNSLFALATEDTKIWFPPSHIFQVDGCTQQVLLYRLRFFFPNWFGQGNKKSYRCGVTKECAGAVLDYSVIDYLFAQSRSDFVTGFIKIPLDLQMQEECLGMAVLDIMRISKERKWSLQQICEQISYKSCIPSSLRQQIQQHNFLTRKRIRRKFYKSLKKISLCEIDLRYLKLKYLLDMENLEAMPNQEIFSVKDQTWEHQTHQVHKTICVSGEHGIQWRIKEDEEGTKSGVAKFVDDTKLSGRAHCNEDVESLQRDIVKLDEWAKFGSARGLGKLVQCGSGARIEIVGCWEVPAIAADRVKMLNETISQSMSYLSDVAEVTTGAPDARGALERRFSRTLPGLENLSYELLIWMNSLFLYLQCLSSLKGLIYSLSFADIMVQEYMKYGALDIYLKKNKNNSCVNISWKLEVAKQLAYAMNFLDDKQIVHGNVCARNVLLTREGDPTAGYPPFIKLSDPGVSVTILPSEVRIDRIPWLAPEYIDKITHLIPESDRWSFGTTLWEIFSGGDLPLHSMEPKQKLQFYKDHLQLPAPRWTELANLINWCMNYRPELRPSFRATIRELNRLNTSDYERLCDLSPTGLPNTNNFWNFVAVRQQEDPILFEERHLKFISMLGKGNFGSVELCQYDPLDDNTGDLVAVKKLQHTTRKHLYDFEREIAVVKNLHNEHIVKYKGVCCSAGRKNLRLIMEYLPHGSLRDYLQKNRDRLDHNKLFLYASQICKGMEYLGSKRYVHRDLATRNILVESDTCVKIGDFGLTKILPGDKDYYKVLEAGESPIFWYAIESLSDSKFSRESDVWSFGVLLYELFTYGDHSRSPPMEFQRMIGSDKQRHMVFQMLEVLKTSRLPKPQDCPSEVYNVMLTCWSKDPAQRPTFVEMLYKMEERQAAIC